MAPSDRRLAMPRLDSRSLGLAFVPGLPRVGAVVQRTGPERRPRPLATPQGRRAHIGSDLFPFNPLEETIPRGIREQRLPYRHTDEARRKISAANKGNVPWNKGRKHSEETKRKIAAATKMAMRSPHVRERLREQATGRKHSEETKRKIRHASRVLHGSADLAARRTRSKVPFKFSTAMVAALDSRISKRFKKEYMDGSVFSEKGGIRRPMSEATKKKLSARIKEMWASPDYRERVLTGIEEANKSKEPRSPLSESHKEAIRQTLLKRHAELRKVNGTDKPKPRRRSRSSISSLDPTEGTRFSERNMSSKTLREREQRRLRTSQILFEAEQEENDEFEENPQVRAERRRVEAEEEAARLRESQMQHEADRQLLESLAKAGQLPPLDEEGAMFGSSIDLSDANASRDTSNFFDFGLDMATGSPFLGNGLNIEDSGALKDPLLCSPESTSLSRSLSAVQPSFNDIFISAEEQYLDNSSFALTSSPSVLTKSTSKPRNSLTRPRSVQEETAGIPLTESVPLGQRLAYAEPDEEEGDVVDDVDEDEDDASDANEEDELSNADTNGIVPSNELSDSLGSAADSAGSSGYANEFDDVVARGSSLLQSMAASKRIVTYINGERVLQSTTSL